MEHQRIVPFLWFDDQAEQAARLYSDVFPRSRILSLNRYGGDTAEVPGQPQGGVMVADLELDGYRISGMNAGPVFRPNPSISFSVRFLDRDGLDRAWARLADGGVVLMPLDEYAWSPRYGWLSDRHGVSWQLSLDTPGGAGPRVLPSLMFTGAQAGRAAEAMDFYCSVFPNSGVQHVMHHAGDGAERPGTVAHAQFQLDGQAFTAMDSALPHAFAFSEGVSLMILCDTQDEVDRLWSALPAGGGEDSMCGWVKDRFGVSWQITPSVLPGLMTGPAGDRVMGAMLKMRKLDIAALQAAAA